MKLTYVNLYCVMLALASLSASCKKITGADKLDPGTEALNDIGPVAPYS
jgi:hypothetical protein